jgi:two-component system NarL family sensor kinase
MPDRQKAGTPTVGFGIGLAHDPARARAVPGSPSVARPVAAFVLSGLAALALVTVLGAFAVDRLATEEAVRDARGLAGIMATGIVEPAIPEGLVNGDAAAVDALDAVVRARVLDDSIVRVKVWDAAGTILYADARDAVGQTYVLGDDAREALATGAGHAELSSLTRPENASEQGLAPVLEVYQPVTSPEGRPLLLEIYVRYESILSGGRALWMTFVPALVLALAVLFAVQVPLAIRLSRQLRARHREREELLRQALNASDAERRRIAAHLHDGVVQDLTALSFDLALTDDSGSRQAADGIRRASRQLRALMIDLYPPNLRSAGLRGALEDLLEPLSARGIQTSLVYEPPATLDTTTEVVVYRVAREAIRNAGAHAQPTRVDVRVGETDGHVTLEIRDDGRGFAGATAANRAAEGHLGLRLMRDVAREAGTHLQIDSAPGAGTLVRLDGRT